MKSSDILRDNVNALITKKGWKSHKPLIKKGSLTNGTLGRLRSPEGENVRLSTLDELAKELEVRPHDLITPAGEKENTWRKAGEILANQSKFYSERDFLLNFLTAIDEHLKGAERIAESIPDTTER